MLRTWIALAVFAACGSNRPEPAAISAPPAAGATVETFAELAVGPGNIAVTPQQRVFLSLHQFYEPVDRVVELVNGELRAYPPGGPKLDSVLGIRADERGVVWMLDNAMRGKGKRQLVGWNARKEALESTVDLMTVSRDDAFLNDLAVDRTHEAIYIADPAGGKTAAIIVVPLAGGPPRRVLEGHASVVPEDRELVIDGTPVEIAGPDGTRTRPRIGINPIALDARDEWLYFGPMHGSKLYRVPTSALRDAALSPESLAERVEVYAGRPITDGIAIDSANNIYLGDLANNAIGVIDAERRYRELARGPELSWIDAFSYGPDGYYYAVANQLHRSAVLNAGTSATKPPYRIVRFKALAPGRVGR